VTNVRNVIIWGNHSSTQYPDVNHGTADGRPIRQVLAGQDEWLDNVFVEVVQQRGAAVIKVGVGGLGGCTPSVLCVASVACVNVFLLQPLCAASGAC
jgi:malate/lactate dehydrogenase